MIVGDRKMGRVSSVAVVLCAVALGVSCNPYSKIADGVQFGEGFASQKSTSSSSSSSSSYSRTNHGNLAAIDGTGSGNVFVGAKSVAYSNNGASHSSSYSSSVSSSSEGTARIPASLAASAAAALANHGLATSLGTTGGYAANVRDARPFWWMGSDSPFLGGGAPSVGCTSNGCLASTVFRRTSNDAAATGVHSSSIPTTNPFLGGSIAAGSSHGSNDASSHEVHAGSGAATVSGSSNPFLQVAGATNRYASSGASGASASSLSSSLFQDSSSGSLNSGNSAVLEFGQATLGSVNGDSFYQQANEELPSFSGYAEQRPSKTGSTGINRETVISGASANDEGLFSVTCTGQARVCVPYYLCSAKGYVKPEGLSRVRSGSRQVCDLNNEVCCTLAEDSTKVGNFGSGSDDGYHGTINQAGKTEGGFSGVSSGGSESNNGYLPPPIGGSPSSNVPAFTNPPEQEEEEPDRIGGADTTRNTRIFPPAAVPPPQVGCAAALLCVEEEFCSLQGVITTEPIALSSEQLVRRVPLSSCKNPDNGIIGKCCRDPNYVDPWPTGNLPANYTGGFDEQGFPTILNIAKTRPTKTQRPTKTVRPSSQPQRPNHSAGASSPNLIDASSNKPVSSTSQTRKGPIESPRPYGGSVKSTNPYAGGSGGFAARPYGPSGGFPATHPTSDVQPPFVKSNYDSSASNESPIILEPHPRGSLCGRRNTVRTDDHRDNASNEAELAFGEIPWQAMILSNTERKLLCSGVIVARNVVATAASCVHGLRPEQVSIKSGEWKLGYELEHEEPLPFEIVGVDSIVAHPSYSPGSPAHDLALLFLEHELKTDRHVGELCLPQGNPELPTPGKRCIATGWGKIVLQANVAGALMRGVKVDVLDEERCLRRIAAAEKQILLHDSLFCGVAHNRANNMCQVDFGGPLACERSDGFYELVGIYNQDTGCLPTNQVSTFVKIPSRWIETTIADRARSPSPLGNDQPPRLAHEPPCNCQEQDHLSSAGSTQYLPPV